MSSQPMQHQQQLHHQQSQQLSNKMHLPPERQTLETAEKEIQTEEDTSISSLPKMHPMGFKRAFLNNPLASTLEAEPQVHVATAAELPSSRKPSPRGISESQRSTVDEILESIRSLKETKRELGNLPESPSVVQLREDLRVKMEKKLSQLLLHIMEDPSASTDINRNLKTVLRDIDKLKGKVVEGHLKTRLLFQFLKEYKKIAHSNGRNSGGSKSPFNTFRSHLPSSEGQSRVRRSYANPQCGYFSIVFNITCFE